MKNAILPSAIVTISSTTAAYMLPNKYGGMGELPTPRLLFGTIITFTGLSILAGFAPGIANPLAVIIALTALTYYGVPILTKYTGDSK